ncbi:MULTISPECIES: hypothetical protein [Vibrio]|uniref:Uncharacterized protein n=1 Tax=Vibrio tasmaniensis TaxID=212663 RepID=A0A2N7NN93_9VIBR|nr:hypothetical protein [Vibrio tasmaniensis]PMO89910.1 hypothetical protein BCT01_01100 [Vibrio tasmaniensis]PMP17777.1 hypothetical protein BCS92_05055 [Vibrio tasmaniensis]TKG28015.1 hypothetical protein FC057_22775 [Vibrio tasmaniensis]TKG41620.1 hypothetical protein FC063_07095 [Vibrio tasmaniensis]TKG44864.1 hypothetical protein FC061_20230 [Vibrio tasmaniensis]
MDIQEFDLGALRCPDMQIKLRTFLKAWVQGNQMKGQKIVVRSIDPRFLDNVRLYLVNEPAMKHVRLIQDGTQPLSEGLKQEIISSPDSIYAFSLDDFDGCNFAYAVLLEFSGE